MQKQVWWNRPALARKPCSTLHSQVFPTLFPLFVQLPLPSDLCRNCPLGGSGPPAFLPVMVVGDRWFFLIKHLFFIDFPKNICTHLYSFPPFCFFKFCLIDYFSVPSFTFFLPALGPCVFLILSLFKVKGEGGFMGKRGHILYWIWSWINCLVLCRMRRLTHGV